MMPERNLCLTAALLAQVLLHAFAGFAAELPLTHFSPGLGRVPLPSASVQKIIQDQQGYIWLGFYSSGIARYDGRSMEVYSTADGLGDLTVRELAQSSDGRLWVGSETGLSVSLLPLASYGPGKRIRFGRSFDGKDLLKGRLRRNCLVADPAGGVWVGTTGEGAIHYEFDAKGELRVERRPTAAGGGAQPPISAMVVMRDASLWAALGTGEVIRIHRDQGIAPVVVVPPLADCSISALFAGRTRLWGGCVEGSIWYRTTTGELKIIPTGQKERVASLLESSAGDLWAPTLGSGVIRIAASIVDPQLLTRRQGFLGDTFWSVLEDREGNLWFGQNGGLSRLPADFSAFSYLIGGGGSGDSARPEGSAFAVIPARTAAAGSLERYLWIATDAGVLAIDGDRAVINLESEHHGLASDSVYGLGFDQQGRLWMATGAGLSCLSPVDAVPPALGPSTRHRVVIGEKPYTVSTFPFDTVYSCKFSSIRSGGAERVPAAWFSGAGGIHLLAGEEWFVLRSSAGLPAAGATTIAVDESERLWIGTNDSGVLRSSGPFTLDLLRSSIAPAGRFGREVGQIVVAPLWNMDSGSRSNSARNLLLHGGRVWIGTSAGVGSFPSTGNGSPDQYLSDAIGGELVVGMAASPVTGNIWISHNNGLTELDPRGGRVVRKVSRADGLRDNESWAYGSVAVAPSGEIYFATTKGVVIYRPVLDRVNRVAPRVMIRNASFKSDRSGNNQMLFGYAALSFANESSVLFRTRLSGYEREWSPPTRDLQLRYTNLPAFLFPRTYIFEVTASNNDGVWATTPARYSFEVRPPWWSHWATVLAFLVGITLALALGSRFRGRRFVRETSELEALVERRTAEIRSQAMELETLDRIVQHINRETSLEQVLRALLEQGLTLFPQAEKAVFLIFDHKTERCEIAAVSGYDPDQLRGISFSVEEAVHRYCEGGELLAEGVYLVRDVVDLPEYDRIGNLPKPKSMLAMEVALGGLLEGMLIFDNFSDANAFSGSDVRKLSRFREHSLSAISKARMLREIEAKRFEAEQANRAKSAFLANMSHELRTPLNSIIGFSEILTSRLEGKILPKHIDFLKLILTSGQHLLNIINDILDLSKVEAGKMELFRESIPIRPAIESVCHLVRGISSKQLVSFDIDVEENLPLLDADPVKFKQILYNLLSNAVKFSSPGSRIEVRAKQSTLAEGVPAVEISVRDEGIGIASEELSTIFEEFRQIDSSLGRKFDGTGLGLALVRKFVELQGGTVSVESELGRGSTFSFRLPLGDVPESSPLRTDETISSANRERVLVVEDDEASYEVISRHLATAGYLPIRARRGEDAMQIAQEVSPVAITLDILLPGLDGWQVLKQLKSSNLTSHLPVVMISMSENLELALALGADDTFTKPLDSVRLLQRLKELTESRATGRRPKLLLIDDDEAVHDLLRDDLVAQGFDVWNEMSGEAGLRRFRSDPPDIVILDLTMGDMSGFEVAEALSQQPEGGKVPIVVLTSRELDATERERLGRSTHGFVAKGAATSSRLIDAIRRVRV